MAFPADASAFEAADALICDRIAALRADAGRSILVGLSGPQGSGIAPRSGSPQAQG